MKDCEIKKASTMRTICEVLREINDMHQSFKKHDCIVRQKLVEAEGMAKKMSQKLFHYNKEVFKDFWEVNKDYEADVQRRISESYLTGEGTKK